MGKKILDRKGLWSIKERVDKEKKLRQGGDTVRITVHMGTCGIASGAQDVMEAVLEETSKCGRSDISPSPTPRMFHSSNGCPWLLSSHDFSFMERTGSSLSRIL